MYRNITELKIYYKMRHPMDQNEYVDCVNKKVTQLTT